MSLLWKRQNIGIKTEATEGTAIAMTATDYLLVENLAFKPGITMLERNFMRGSLDPLSRVVGKKMGEVSFNLPIKGSGTPATIYTPFGAVLQAAAYSETAGGGNVTYAPISAKPTGFSSAAKSCTACFQVDGVQIRLSACIVTSLKWTLKAGVFGMLNVTLKGKYEAPTDVALATPTFLTTVEPIFQSSAFTFDSVSTFVIETLEIDCGIESAERPNSLVTDGFAGYLYVGRNPVGSFDPELVLNATYNFPAKQVTATPASLSAALGATAGNINTLTLPKAQIISVDFAERNGIAIAKCGLAFSQNTGDDWMSFVQT